MISFFHLDSLKKHLVLENELSEINAGNHTQAAFQGFPKKGSDFSMISEYPVRYNFSLCKAISLCSDLFSRFRYKTLF